MVDRLFQIVYMLMEKPQMTAKELSEVFEVSERTIYRDVDKLTLAGIPIYTNQGKNGGISILPDYVLNKTVLTKDEKDRILESLNALSEVTFSKDSETMSKLHAFLGEQHQDWIEIAFSSWGNSEEEASLFAKIKDATLGHYFIEILYSGNQGASTKRKVKPLKLCFKDQAWYLYAYCCLREDYRFFKLKRISKLTVLDAYFEPEKVGKVLQQSSKDYSQNVKVVRATLEISPDMAFRAYEELTNLSVTDQGTLVCTMDVTDVNWLISYILSYGSRMRVLEPPEIKERVMQEIEKMRKMY